MISTFKINKADLIGILSSSICLVHCIASTLIIVCSESCCEDPVYKYIFLSISFISIYKATENITNAKIALLLWISFFGFLFSTLFQEQIYWLNYSRYLFTVLIITGHILNIKDCKECSK